MWEVNGRETLQQVRKVDQGRGGSMLSPWITSSSLPPLTSHSPLPTATPSCSFCGNRKESHADTATKELPIDVYSVERSRELSNTEKPVHNIEPRTMSTWKWCKVVPRKAECEWQNSIMIRSGGWARERGGERGRYGRRGNGKSS